MTLSCFLAAACSGGVESGNGEGEANDPTQPAPSGSDDGNTPNAPSGTAPTGSDGTPTMPPNGSNPTDGPARLTQAELNNTLRDLLGDDSRSASVYLAEDEFSPFDNDIARQTVSQALVDSMQALAEDVATSFVADVARRDARMPCTPAAANDENCFDQAVETFGRRFLRRDLTQAEMQSYRPLLAFAEEKDDFFVAIELLLRSLLQDPEFLYRTEREGGGGKLNGFEIATRASYLLLGTTPSDELLDSAASGELDNSAARRALASTLLDDPKAQNQLSRFFSMWLGYRAIPHERSLTQNFQLETEALINRVAFSDSEDYMMLFNSNETYLTTELANHYGLPEPSGGEGWVTYPSDSNRLGLLSHGSVLSAFSKFTDTSPTQRGIFVKTRLLCEDIPPPPPTVDVDQPPGEDEAECKIARYEEHRTRSGCVDCHNLFDPIGIGLENFDVAGRYREHDDGNPDCKITEPGSLPGYGEFRGPKELATLLSENDLIGACLVKHYLTFARGRTPESAGDEAALTTLAASLDNDRNLKTWLMELLARDDFAQRRWETNQ